VGAFQKRVQKFNAMVNKVSIMVTMHALIMNTVVKFFPLFLREENEKKIYSFISRIKRCDEYINGDQVMFVLIIVCFRRTVSI